MPTLAQHEERLRRKRCQYELEKLRGHLKFLEQEEEAEYAEFEGMKRIVENHFTALAQTTNPKSYGVGHDAKVVDLMVTIRSHMEDCEMYVGAIGRCIRYRIRALEAFIRVEEQRSVRSNGERQRSLTSDITNGERRRLLTSDITNELGRALIGEEEDDESIKSEEHDDNVETEEEEEIVRVDRNGFHYLAQSGDNIALTWAVPPMGNNGATSWQIQRAESN